MNRYYGQKGVVARASFIIGGLMQMTCIGGSLPFLIPTLIGIYSNEPLPRAIGSSLELLLAMIAFVWSLPILLGSFLIGAFPDIRLSERGIEYRVFHIVRSEVRWDEVIGIVNLGKGFRAIQLFRKGPTLLNGFYSNKIYGDIVKSKFPVILLSPQLENIEQISATIASHVRLPA